MAVLIPHSHQETPPQCLTPQTAAQLYSFMDIVPKKVDFFQKMHFRLSRAMAVTEIWVFRVMLLVLHGAQNTGTGWGIANRENAPLETLSCLWGQQEAKDTHLQRKQHRVSWKWGWKWGCLWGSVPVWVQTLLSEQQLLDKGVGGTTHCYPRH